MTRALARILLVLVVVAGCASTSAPPAGADSPPATLAATVTVADAAVLRDGGAFVLDVREPSEWAEGHIPGAVLIPLDELGARLADVPRDRQVVVVCRSGNRSAQGRDILLGAGFPAVTSLAGGMIDWANADLPIDTGG